MRDLVPFTSGIVALTALATSLSLACGPGEPRTDAERLARGREIIERMSAKLAAAPVYSVTTSEVRDEIQSSGASEQVTLTRATVVRKPDRFYSAVTGGCVETGELHSEHNRNEQKDAENPDQSGYDGG